MRTFFDPLKFELHIYYFYSIPIYAVNINENCLILFLRNLKRVNVVILILKAGTRYLLLTRYRTTLTIIFKNFYRTHLMHIMLLKLNNMKFILSRYI